LPPPLERSAAERFLIFPHLLAVRRQQSLKQGKNLIERATGDVRVPHTASRPPLAAGEQVAHLAIDHRYSGWGVFHKHREQLWTVWGVHEIDFRV
jgi:hypothetical protein